MIRTYKLDALIKESGSLAEAYVECIFTFNIPSKLSPYIRTEKINKSKTTCISFLILTMKNSQVDPKFQTIKVGLFLFYYWAGKATNYKLNTQCSDISIKLQTTDTNTSDISIRNNQTSHTIFSSLSSVHLFQSPFT